jgi:hypothetical protein
MNYNGCDSNTIHETNSLVCIYQQDYLSITLGGVNAENVWWLWSCGGVVVEQWCYELIKIWKQSDPSEALITTK